MELVPVQGHPGLQSQGVARRQPAGGQRRHRLAVDDGGLQGRRGTGDDRPQVHGVLRAAEQLEAVLTRVAGTGQQHRVPRRRRSDGRVEAQALQERGTAQHVRSAVFLLRALKGPESVGHGGTGLDDADEHLLRPRPLDGDEAGAQRDVLDRAVEARATGDQLGGDALAVAGVGNHEVLLVAHVVDDEVIDDPAGGRDDHRVAGAPHRHGRQGPHERVVQGGARLGAGDLDLTHVGQVEDPRAAAHRVVLGQVRGVAQRHLPAAEVGEGRAQGRVHAVQGRGAQDGCAGLGVLAHRCLLVRRGLGSGLVRLEGIGWRAGAHQVAVAPRVVHP